MGQRQETSGPQFRGDRPAEQPAVRTTIVGGRPPGSGHGIGAIPRGIEVLVKKASVDPAFRELLLARRAEVAEEIGLVLDPAEVMMLAAVPADQLEAVIARTSVPQAHRRAFLGKVAAAMLAAIAVASQGCSDDAGIDDAVAGIRPEPPPSEPPPLERPERVEPSHGDRPPPPDPQEPPMVEGESGQNTAEEEPEGGIRGIRPDRIPVTDGIRPDPVAKGIRPGPVPKAPPPAPTGIRPD